MNFNQMFPIDVNVFDFTQICIKLLICPDVIEAVGPYPNAPNLPKCFKFFPKPNEAFSIDPSLMKAVGLSKRF